MRGVAYVSDEHAARFLDQQEAGPAGKAAKVSNVRKVTDEERVQPAGSQLPAQIFLTASMVHCPEFNRQAIEELLVLNRAPRSGDSLFRPKFPQGVCGILCVIS